eukprot:XP_003729946.1 PREDICTED: uncharacterized protein LOC100891774 [Strongylocentrotus purpuratus]
MDAMGSHVGVISLTVCIVLQSNFISTTANTSPAPLLPLPLQNGTTGNITLPKPCNEADLERGSLINLTPIKGSNQTLTVTCPHYFTLIGPRNLECIDGRWAPQYESLQCIAPCNTTNSFMPQNMVTHPPLSPSEIVLPTTTFVTACQPGPGQPPPFQPQRPGGPPRPNEPLPVLGELLCYDSTWYLNGLYECTEEEVPVVTSTESMVVSSTESMVDEVEKNCSEPVIAGNMTAVEHAEVATGSTFPASIVYALSALVGLLLVLLLVLSICLCQSRR